MLPQEAIISRRTSLSLHHLKYKECSAP